VIKLPQVELLIKPVSYRCNLNCTYCFYQKTSAVYPDTPRIMEDDVLERLILQAMSLSGQEPCVFSWQGGEPLLAGVDFFSRAVGLQKKYGKSGQVVSNTFQTNLTSLTREWTDLFKKYHFFVGVSLDGPENIHNHYRRYRSGEGSFRRVMEGINLLREEGVEFNILSTIGRETVKDVEKIYQFFLSKDLLYLQFIPAVDRRKGTMANFSVAPDEWGKFLCDLFDLWWEDGDPSCSIRFFDNILEVLLEQRSSSCMFREECGEYIVVEANGDVYPCDFFVRREWKLGNILDAPMEDLFLRAKLKFGKLKRIPPPDCKNCKWAFLCHNGCLWFRWVRKGRIEDKDYLCGAYKRFFSHAMERFEEMRDSILLRRILEGI
jgi:uncharacterized protein